jgi:hypothetical protein
VAHSVLLISESSSGESRIVSWRTLKVLGASFVVNETAAIVATFEPWLWPMSWIWPPKAD